MCALVGAATAELDWSRVVPVCVSSIIVFIGDRGFAFGVCPNNYSLHPRRAQQPAKTKMEKRVSSHQKFPEVQLEVVQACIGAAKRNAPLAHLSRDGLLPFSQASMPYFRRRMVLEILTTNLL